MIIGCTNHDAYIYGYRSSHNVDVQLTLGTINLASLPNTKSRRACSHMPSRLHRPRPNRNEKFKFAIAIVLTPWLTLRVVLYLYVHKTWRWNTQLKAKSDVLRRELQTILICPNIFEGVNLVHQLSDLTRKCEFGRSKNINNLLTIMLKRMWADNQEETDN